MSESKRVVVHPGWPKCGSSSIQRFLHDNSHPDVKMWLVWWKHARLFAEAETGFDLIVSELAASPANTAVISDERMINFSEERWKYLASLCAEYGIQLEFTVSLRPIDSFIASYYSQVTRRLRGENFEPPVEKWLDSSISLASIESAHTSVISTGSTPACLLRDFVLSSSLPLQPPSDEGVMVANKSPSKTVTAVAINVNEAIKLVRTRAAATGVVDPVDHHGFKMARKALRLVINSTITNSISAGQTDLDDYERAVLLPPLIDHLANVLEACIPVSTRSAGWRNAPHRDFLERAKSIARKPEKTTSLIHEALGLRDDYVQEWSSLLTPRLEERQRADNDPTSTNQQMIRVLIG